jgi:hypothetical protein
MKRKKPTTAREVLEDVYDGVTCLPRASAGQRDSPHFVFASSYTVSISKPRRETSLPKETIITCSSNNEIASQAVDNQIDAVVIPQVAHCHVNGLCIVTAGDVAAWLGTLYPKKTIKSVQMVAKEPPSSSAAEKRKRQAKMLRGGKVEHAVTPTTILAKLTLGDDFGDRKEDGIEISLYACVWGTIVELNENLNPKILMEDPLLDGYLAVILPSGKFPPKNGTSA